MQKIRIDATYYDDANGLYITPVSYRSLQRAYECTVEHVTYNGDLELEGTQLLTGYDLRNCKEVKR